MEAYEVIRLIGACVAFILGAIMLLVTFFRVMSWMDRWIMGRNETDLSHRSRKRKGRRPSGNSSVRNLADVDSRLAENHHPIEPASPAASEVRRILARREPLLSLKNSAIAKSKQMVEANEDSEQVAKATADSAQSEKTSDAEQVAKSLNRIATVHLMSGDTVEKVAFCGKEKATKICDGLGFEGVVFETDEGKICVVRKENIKMVTWKAG